MRASISLLVLYYALTLVYMAVRPTHHEHSTWVNPYARWDEMHPSTNIEDIRDE